MSFNDATLRQHAAARPDVSTWVTANAGSGKTRVLTDRVARLLLDGVSPQNVLCLTYTKAAASEMQNRLFKRLGEWAMLPDEDLQKSLSNLGETRVLNRDDLANARTRGYEFSVQGQFSKTFRQRLSYAWLDARDLDARDLDAGAPLINRAEHVAKLMLTWQPHHRWDLTLTGEYQGGLTSYVNADTGEAIQNARRTAMWTTIGTFLISLPILFGFDPNNPDFQFVEDHKWLGGFSFKLGVDGISILFVMLTTFLMPLVIWSSWGVEKRVKEYMIAFLVLEALMIGVFVALDMILFYLFFEAGLIPMFLIIGVWGGKDRVYAAFKFFLYTLLGSLLMLVAMIYMAIEVGTDIPTLLNHTFESGPIEILGWQIAGGVQTLLWLAFFASFAVKMPMWPVHTWLPDAHVQAPTAGSVVLAAIL